MKVSCDWKFQLPHTLPKQEGLQLAKAKTSENAFLDSLNQNTLRAHANLRATQDTRWQTSASGSNHEHLKRFPVKSIRHSEFPGYQPPSTPMLWALSNSYCLEVASTCLVEKATTAAVGAQWALWESGSPAPGENHPDFWILF